MFFDYDDYDDVKETPTQPDPELVNPPGNIPEDPDAKPRPPHSEEIQDTNKRTPQWKRVERRIYSPLWRALHNIIAHPMLAIYRPLGEMLHEFTARKMYEPRGGLSPIVTNND